MLSRPSPVRFTLVPDDHDDAERHCGNTGVAGCLTGRHHLAISWDCDSGNVVSIAQEANRFSAWPDDRLGIGTYAVG